MSTTEAAAKYEVEATKANPAVVGDAQARRIIRECIAESMSCRSDIEDANSELDALIESHANLLKALQGLLHEDGGSLSFAAGNPKCIFARAAIEDATGVL